MHMCILMCMAWALRVYTQVPDESIFQTIAMHSAPHKRALLNHNLRWIDWPHQHGDAQAVAISPISPLHLPFISPSSPLHLSFICPVCFDAQEYWNRVGKGGRDFVGGPQVLNSSELGLGLGLQG